MRLFTSLVAVKKITSLRSRSDFDGESLEKLAQQILKAEGIINPIVVSRTSLESYEVMDGDFEYYAGVRAREIDPRKAEMISVFIIEPENDAVNSAIEKQIELLRQSSSPIPTPAIVKTVTPLPVVNFQSILDKLQLLEELITKFSGKFQSLEQSIEKLKENEIIVPVTSKERIFTDDEEKILDKLNALPEVELKPILKKAGIRSFAITAKAIVKSTKSSSGKFQWCDLDMNIVRKIIDNWK
jgi:hypothetical protein